MDYGADYLKIVFVLLAKVITLYIQVFIVEIKALGLEKAVLKFFKKIIGLYIDL